MFSQHSQQSALWNPFPLVRVMDVVDSPALSRWRKSFGLPNRIVRNFQKDCRSLDMAVSGLKHDEGSNVTGCRVFLLFASPASHTRPDPILVGERRGVRRGQGGDETGREGQRQVVVRRANCCVARRRRLLAQFPDRRTWSAPSAQILDVCVSLSNGAADGH